MIHIVMVMAVATACLLFSYYYLYANAPAWPPGGVSANHGLAAARHWRRLRSACTSLMAYLGFGASAEATRVDLKGWLTGALLGGALFVALV